MMTISAQIERLRDFYRLMNKFQNLPGEIPTYDEVMELVKIIRNTVKVDDIKEIAESLKELERMQARERQREIDERQGRLI